MIPFRPFLIPQYLYFWNGPIICNISAVPEASILLKVLFRTLYEGLTSVFIFLVTLIAYAITVRRIQRELDFNPYQLFWYPFVVLLVTVPSLIDDYYQIFHSSSHIVLLTTHILSHSIGILNAIVYGWHFRFRRGTPGEIQVPSPGQASDSTSLPLLRADLA